MKNLILIILIIFISGCSTTSLIDSSPLTQKKINYPQLNTVSIANLGESLVYKGNSVSGSAFSADNELSTLAPLCEMKVKPNQTKFITKMIPEKGMQCAEFRIFNTGDGISPLCIPNIEGNTYICKSELSGEAKTYPGNYTLDGTKISVVEKYVESLDNFRQELIYNGRLGDGLKFIYREYKSDLARPAFTQEIQYDLNTSKIIGFKSVKIEIIEATNMRIEYKVISNF